MTYRIVKDCRFDEVFREISIFKYNLNHQEFVQYIHDQRDNSVNRFIYDTTPRN